MSSTGKETVLYRFKGSPDGAFPYAVLLRDKTGNLYGTTSGGGTDSDCGGCGTVFKVAKTGKETVLYSFANMLDGYFPAAGVVMDAKGNLYGTTSFGGDSGTGCNGNGCGTVFKLTP
jgi:uncharacterized repeat protein (TIGR03803 family)